MDHLAISTSSRSTAFPESEHSRSLYRCRDKGKARASNYSDDDLQLLGLESAEPSSSGRSLCPFDTASSSQRTCGSIGRSDRKGKAREQSVDIEAPRMLHGQNDLDQGSASISSSQADLRPLRRSLTGSSDRYTVSSFHDDGSLKRSIRELGPSPSNSPRHRTLQLPSSRACASSSRNHLNAMDSEEILSLDSAAPSSVTPVRLNTAYKKRRSLRRQDRQSEPSEASVDRFTARTPVTESSRLNATLRSETHARRASLLVNSSTSDIRALETSSSFGATSEFMQENAPHTEQPSSDLSQRRSAFLDSARAQRSSGTIRCRRGFYVRDADLLRNAPPTEAPDDLARPSSRASDTSFMSDFTRAVDLRLGSRSDSPLGAAFASSAALLPEVEQEQASLNAMSHRHAPQLPYVRSASPLTVPFAAAAEVDGPRQVAQHGRTLGSLRRRNLLPTSDRSQQDQQQAADIAMSSRSYFHRGNLEPPPTHIFEDRMRTFGIFSRGIPSAQRETHAEQAHMRGAHVTDAAADRAPLSSRRPHFLSPHGLQAANSDRVGAEDYGAAHRPFGHQGNRSSRRTFRSRVEQEVETAQIASEDVGLSRGERPWRYGDDSTELRRHQETDPESSPVPWRRTQFGLLTPSHPAERPTAPARPRFEPFAESPNTGTRPPTGLPNSRGGPLSTLLRRERNEDESALEYLGRLMSHDSMLDEWMAGDVHGPLLRMAIESEALASNPHLRQLHLPPASSTSNMPSHAAHLAFDARNFIADDEWAELNTYEGLVQLSERLGAADVGVPQSLIDALPTCEYAQWDGGSCRPRDSLSPPLLGKGKGKQKVPPPATIRDTMCPICREDYLDSDRLMSIERCCHAFHAECIQTWLRTAKTCPLCRADAFDRVCLPALPFQSSSSAAAAARGAPAGSALWSFDF